MYLLDETTQTSSLVTTESLFIKVDSLRQIVEWFGEEVL
jgi:hypothetical protein